MRGQRVGLTALCMAVLVTAGCTQTDPSMQHPASSHEAAGSAIVRGTVLQYGGPLAANGTSPMPRPVKATAVLYRGSADEIAASGSPVAQSRTDNGGNFSITVTPGRYLIVAELTDGSLTAPKRITVNAGTPQTVNLEVSVP